jgi:two-component system nitrate/nitrite response regulator NarL
VQLSEEEQRITVYVAEDHPVFREAVGRAVTEHPKLELAGSSADGREALNEILTLKPAVALLDQKLPSMSGIDILRAIQRDSNGTRVVMLTAESSSAFVYDALKLGASGFLTKAATIDAICDAVASAARGATVLAPEVQSGLANELRSRETRQQAVLSERESQVLALIADGLSAPAIAQRLYISPSTVKTHVQNLFEKLGVSDRAAAVAEAMRRGLLE